jgi:hypothetical protein
VFDAEAAARRGVGFVEVGDRGVDERGCFDERLAAGLRGGGCFGRTPASGRLRRSVRALGVALGGRFGHGLGRGSRLIVGVGRDQAEGDGEAFMAGGTFETEQRRFDRGSE